MVCSALEVDFGSKMAEKSKQRTKNGLLGVVVNFESLRFMVGSTIMIFPVCEALVVL